MKNLMIGLFLLTTLSASGDERDPLQSTVFLILNSVTQDFMKDGHVLSRDVSKVRNQILENALLKTDQKTCLKKGLNEDFLSTHAANLYLLYAHGENLIGIMQEIKELDLSAPHANQWMTTGIDIDVEVVEFTLFDILEDRQYVINTLESCR